MLDDRDAASFANPFVTAARLTPSARERSARRSGHPELAACHPAGLDRGLITDARTRGDQIDVNLGGVGGLDHGLSRFEHFEHMNPKQLFKRAQTKTKNPVATRFPVAILVTGSQKVRGSIPRRSTK